MERLYFHGVAKVWVERGVHCALMGTWLGAGGEVVFSVFDGYMAGCGWRGVFTVL